MNLKEAYEKFIFSRDAFCSDETVKNYKNTLKYFTEFIAEKLGKDMTDIDVNEITIVQLNEYSIYLKSKVKNEGHPFYPVSNSVTVSSRTRRTYLTDMKTFIKWLRDENYLVENILLRFRMPRSTGKVIEPLTCKEAQRIDETFSKNKEFGLRDLAILHLLLDEGLRSGEVRRLKLSDVNLEEGYIVIRNTKCNKNRVLPLASNCKQYLKEYIEFKRPDVVHQYLFCTLNDEPLTQEAIKGVFDRLRKSANIPRLYPHLLRHTFGTSFILGGGSLELLKHYMGHSDIKTTENYLHVANNYRFCTDVYQLDEVFRKKFY